MQSARKVQHRRAERVRNGLDFLQQSSRSPFQDGLPTRTAMKRVYIDRHFCIGCGLCELACLTVHSRSKELAMA
jgi:NAD-dependent dihydropyrimidine dehydrogenase PreA subunit